ncbi:hypothetical protein KLAE6086_24945 [Klebsiella aerogenes]
MEAESLLLLIRKRHIMLAGGFEQCESTDQVGLDKRGRAINRAVDVAFGRQVHHDIRLEGIELRRNSSRVSNIGLGERVAFVAGYRRQRLEVTGIGQAVHDKDFIPGIFNDMTNNSRTDKTSATGNKDLHALSQFSIS